jgi:hypothetical protein
MEFLRSHIVSRCLRLILALHILNCSVDTFDLHSNTVAEDVNNNDMESFAEVLMEQVLELDNFFAEHDERDDDDGGLVMKKGIDLAGNHSISKFPLDIPEHFRCRLNGNSDSFASQFHPELTSPPPKA